MAEVPTERPKYRAGRKPTAVKVYTVNNESRYLVIENIPALNLKKELLELLSLYGTIEEHQFLDNYPCEEFTDVYWVKFKSISEARVGKRKVDDHVFFANHLRVRYGPEYETIEDTRQKLEDRRKVIAIKTHERKDEKYRKKKETESTELNPNLSSFSESSTHPTSFTPPLPPTAFPVPLVQNFPSEPPVPGIDYQSTSFASISNQTPYIQSEDSQSSTVLSIRQRLKEASTVTTNASISENNADDKLESESSSKVSAPEQKRRRRI
ncbi:10686_t:CDS:2 [Diversispora eburnea]|uniref:RNA-binding protein 48 n=1 Tax=Diversispora eburnea TaxID=1213867 RepID=A0A9N8ZC77_9GLOM|nr:10686_t:CDS:2 [Diversispora eburnea]